ncbi:helix-turn-helix domain-containing protein, partial [Persicitalea sp.]|uniref:helix-turn-helix domain-containing protein n=1 Tax=Persicitalea sp. TaxID=3100273 RepID=UPI003593CA29
GLLLRGELAEQIRPLMAELVAASPLRRIMILLDVLNQLAHTESIESLAPGYTFYQANEQETIRLNRVYDHTLANFTREITLEEIAAVASLSVTSFCRYFKTMTHKTYRQFVNEIRISYACRALIEGRHSIQVICFENGFNNLSNFYRQFKKVQGISPLEYQKSQQAKLASRYLR